MHTVPFTLTDKDVENFTQEIMALRRAANERMGLEDFKHLKKSNVGENYQHWQVMALHGLHLILFLLF